MVEPFAAGVLCTFLPGRVYLKHNSASVVRTIGASNKPSLGANFFTHTARVVKGKTNVDYINRHVWDSGKWTRFASKHSIWCSSKSYFVNKCANQINLVI